MDNSYGCALRKGNAMIGKMSYEKEFEKKNDRLPK
jgi:hypothetical protein